ncbi:gamma-butyrobetaine dioxygenase-like isoform X1 [Homarus americanus]|uniref:gamma-butyrobetaine dioxygenase-like isoform X1 n=1 Tax=Homarus americanus TaxID=6706 RepID=UPI001C4933A7|nr:gamma-butyrobetaine dioxygenase-like isoform X1 [Homarus americanus]
MSCQRYSRLVLSGAAAMRTVTHQQVRRNCNNCNKRGLSLVSCARQQVTIKESPVSGAARSPALKGITPSASHLVASLPDQEGLNVKFGDGSASQMPYVWLRDNCQCSKCYNPVALGRSFLLEDLDVNVHATKVQESEDGVEIEWSDGHSSQFTAEWLYDRAFTTSARAQQRNRYALSREPWGVEHKPAEFDYQTLMEDEKVLLDWLLTMETKGSALVKNTPNRDVAGPDLINNISFVKQSHYGPHSPVINRENTNNVAFTNVKLGMHNDLAQYEQMAGIIFIQCVMQHQGKGGESVISDGLLAAECLRRDHPEAFQVLTTTDAYFWDKGHANFPWEMESFFKISKRPIITLNNDNEVVCVAMNNGVRQSYLDLPSHKVKKFYAALKLFNDILYDNAIRFKMEAGDMMTLDNIRCLHGREGYEDFSPRHIESSYLDWDEARCRRRRLQEKLELFV